MSSARSMRVSSASLLRFAFKGVPHAFMRPRRPHTQAWRTRERRLLARAVDSRRRRCVVSQPMGQCPAGFPSSPLAFAAGEESSMHCLRSLLRSLLRSSLHSLLHCALAPLCLVLLLACGVPAARARHVAPQAESISGIVLNSTHAGAPVAGQRVTLQHVANNQSTPLASTTTGDDGRFTFAQLTPDPGAGYLVSALFQGGTFATSQIAAEQLGAQPLTLHVFDTTTSDAGIQVGLATLVIGEPKQRIGLISVAQSVTLFNTGRTAYVSTLTPTSAGPMNVLRFALPAGATNLVLGAGFAADQVTQVATGLGVAATLPPGKTEFAFAYDLPYAG